MLITDWSIGRDAVLARAAAAGPGVAIQHRHPGATTRVFLDEARELAKLDVLLFINGRLDVALAVNAHLHLPANGVLVRDVRPHLPKGRWVSHAVHSFEEFQSEADLALVSPVFTPRSKPDDPRATLGVAGFEALAARLKPCRVFALGGINEENVETLPSADGFAAIHGKTE